MTRRLGRGDAQRGRARLTLAIVTLLTGGLLMGLAPSGSLVSALAAVNGTPTATSSETNTPAATTTPAVPTTPTIQFLNPSEYADPAIVSNKSDGDSSYHLVAWVGNVGAVGNPVVQFEISGGQTLLASRVGDTDTWQATWNVAEDDGDYTLTAKLMNGANTPPIASDTQDVTVDKTKETAEMSYPTTAGPLGTFDPDGSGPMARGFVVDATVSEDATGIQVFYSTSPPGTEPNWRRCATQVTVSYSEAGSRRIGCTLASDDDDVSVAQIRAVAVVATGVDDLTIPPQCTDPEPGIPPTCETVDSGDAHRVFAYDQFASSLAVTPVSSSPSINTCQDLTAVVLDAQARPIWRANVDVHARRPSDDLRFARTAKTRGWQPPDAGGHSSTENTTSCSGSGATPPQGEHDGGTGDDPNHIESTPDQGGTDTSGAFPFALRSSHQGITAIEAWPDGDDNDVRGTEPLGTATITWSTTTPTKSATGSRSPTGTPPTATTSPTTSPTATQSPSASVTRTASASAGSPAPSSRTITLETSRSRIVFGKRVVFSGVISSDNPDCESGENVKIQRQIVGAPGFSEIGTATSDSNGAFTFGFSPAENASYRAVVDPTPSCQEAISNTRAVAVRVRVGLRLSDKRVFRGQSVDARVSVAPCGPHSATDVVLQRRTGRRFKEVGRKGLNRNCKAVFRKRVNKDARFKARWRSQDDDHESGVSPVRRVKAGPPPGRRNF